jgi:glutamate carboxypeptidase
MQSLSPIEQSILATIEMEPMLAQVQQWASVNSGSANLKGLAETATMLADAFSILPGKLELLDAQPTERVMNDGSIEQLEHGRHLVMTVRPDAPVQFLFTGHMDTVFPVDHSFQELTWLEDGILNGPGVADMKGGLAVLLHALKAIENGHDAPNFGYQILINSDEEVGSPSSAPLITRLAKDKTAALTFEPAALPDGTLAGARAGSGNFSVIITGKSAHAGRNPEDGRNALLAAADLALRMKALTREGLSVNPAKIDGGSPNNVVPDHAILRVNVRPHSPEMQDFINNEIKSLVALIEQEHQVSTHLHGGFGRPPKPISNSAAALFGLVKKCGEDLGLSIAWKSSGGVCDGNNIAACGIPVVDTMGVRGGSIHSADEYLITESLTERAKLSALTILRLASKGSL